jgi:hypothetical protein
MSNNFEGNEENHNAFQSLEQNLNPDAKEHEAGPLLAPTCPNNMFSKVLCHLLIQHDETEYNGQQ